MDENQIIFETEKIIEAAFVLLEDYDDKKAKKIVKRVLNLNDLINRLLLEAETSKKISNIASNELTKERYSEYVYNLTVIKTMFSNYIDYKPKTKVGYYMFIKDITIYANEFEIKKG